MKATDVTTGVIRLSYAHLFQPFAYQQGQEAKYSTTILVPKTDTASKERIDAAIQAAIQAGITDKWGGQQPPKLAIPIYDGDGTRPSDGMPFGPECKGNWVFTASSRQPASVVDQNIQPILDQTKVYSGVYARVSVTFFPYNSNGKKGVGCGLNAVQKVADGEPLGGGVSVDEAFGGANAFRGQPIPAVQGVVPSTLMDPVTGQPVLDPITGRPTIAGGVMGL